MSLDGVTQQATIQPDGSFSTTFTDTAGLGVAGSPYTVDYSYSGDGTFAAASQTSKLTVTPATPTVSVTDLGGDLRRLGVHRVRDGRGRRRRGGRHSRRIAGR